MELKITKRLIFDGTIVYEEEMILGQTIIEYNFTESGKSDFQFGFNRYAIWH